MALDQVIFAINQLEVQRLGYSGISLTHFSDNLEPAIAAGSAVEVGAALYEAAADEPITGLAAIAPSSDVFIKLTVAGASVTASATIVAPTWSTSAQGWYLGAERYVFKLYKDAAGDYVDKRLLLPMPMQQSKELVLDQLTVPAAGLLAAFTAAVGANTIFASDSTRTTTAAAYEKQKAIAIPFSGNVTVDFDIQGSGPGIVARGKVYKNGSAVGVERTAVGAGFTTFSENFAVTRGDVLELYLYDASGAGNAQARNFRVKISVNPVGTLLELLTGPVLN